MVRVALIGTGAITTQNHIPGLRLHPQAEVTALCDTDSQALERARRSSGIERAYADAAALLASEPIDAVVISTPNIFHRPLALEAIAAGKHVLCEKPLAMNHAETEELAAAAERAAIVHMTAFTYRFVPAIRWMKRLIDAGTIGTPYHIRVQRLQDFGDRSIGWRQQRALAGSGELGDMLSHRIDYAHYLIGPIVRLVAATKQYLIERRTADGRRERSDVEDWVAIIGEIEGGVTAVFESSKMATGRGMGNASHDSVEVNGSDGTLVYHLEHPHELRVGKPGGRLAVTPVPSEFLKVPGSPRDPHDGDPLQGFRFDQSFEFVQAIVQGRPASPDFHDGSRVQAVMDAALCSAARREWVTVAGVRTAP
jgi:predicted dehydrogenase